MKTAKEVAEHLLDLENDYYVEDLAEAREVIQQAREDGVAVTLKHHRAMVDAAWESGASEARKRIRKALLDAVRTDDPTLWTAYVVEAIQRAVRKPRRRRNP